MFVAVQSINDDKREFIEACNLFFFVVWLFIRNEYVKRK